MNSIKPLTAAHSSVLESARADIVGKSISNVSYWMNAPVPDLRRLDEAKDVHEFDTVDLVLQEGTALRIRWAIDGADEGLAVSHTEERIDQWGLVGIEVGQTNRWRHLLGQPVTEMRTAWQTTSDRGPELAWALSFRIGDADAFTVALGEFQQGSETYVPNSLLLLFSSADACNYHPLGTPTSAWGEAIAST